MLDKPKEVQVRACKEDNGETGGTEGEVIWCTEKEAQYFSVYSGEPGAFTWNADIDDKLEAINYAVQRAMRLGAKFVDRIGEV